MIEIELIITNKFGDAYSSPLTTLISFSHTARLSRAGDISFSFAASDAQAEHVLPKRNVEVHALLGGSWQLIGRGIIENISHGFDQNGNVTVTVSGTDLLGRLGTRNIRQLEIGEETGATLAEALEIIHTAYDDLATWENYQVSGSVPSDYFYAKFDGESYLSALVYLADKTQTCFYLAQSDLINTVFTASFEDSEVRAIQGEGELAPGTCAVTVLNWWVDTHDLITRIYPYGSGEDRESSLTLAAASITSAPFGFWLDKEENYIEDTIATAEHGLHDFPEFSFKEIEPLSNTDADYQAAGDFLYECAFQELVKRSTLASQRTYDLAVVGCDRVLHPGQTIYLDIFDPAQNIYIGDDLFILEATTQYDTNGVNTSRLKVSTNPIWPKSSGENATERIVQGRIFQKHPQQSQNEWWENATLIIGHDQTDHVAEFPFRLRSSVVLVKQVVFEFKIEPVLAAGYVYRLASDETGQNVLADTGASSATATAGTNTALSGQNNDLTGTQSNTNSGTNNDDTDPSSGDTGNQSLTVTTTGATDVGTTTAATIATRTNSSGTTEETTYTAGALSTNPTNHEHEITAHQHVTSHDHPVVTEHGHTIADHSHPIGTHVHAMNDHLHTITHTHTLNNHAHTITHTHNMPHVHPSPQHVHDVPELFERFTVTRELTSRTYAMDELEYAINGGAWADLDTATSAGDDYFQLDITADLIGAIPHRPAQTNGNNLIEVRGKSSITTLTIIAIGGFGTVTVTVGAPHNLLPGDELTITGTTNFNGTYIASAIITSSSFEFLAAGGATELTGTVAVNNKSCQLLCKLGVRTVIGSIAYIA